MENMGFLRLSHRPSDLFRLHDYDVLCVIHTLVCERFLVLTVAVALTPAFATGDGTPLAPSGEHHIAHARRAGAAADMGRPVRQVGSGGRQVARGAARPERHVYSASEWSGVLRLVFCDMATVQPSLRLPRCNCISPPFMGSVIGVRRLGRLRRHARENASVPK